MMGINGKTMKSSRHRKRSMKSARKSLVQIRPKEREMEEIHLKRRVLDHSSELLLTWWDESNNHQEGLLISCKCKNNCSSGTTAGNSQTPTSTATTSTNSQESDGILFREKLNIRSSPFISKFMDSSCSGVALYADANGLTQPSTTTSAVGISQPRIINIQPQPTIPKMEVVHAPQATGDIGVSSVMISSHAENAINWRNKRPYPCDYCGKPFRTSYEKRRHEMIHTGDRPWKCTECNKAFVDRACLRNHMRKRHLGEKPYKCAFCDITFFDTMNRAKHERTHEERQKTMKSERAEAIQVKQEQGDPSVAIVEVGEQLRQELLHATEQLGVAGNGDTTVLKQEELAQANESNDSEMADVFDITVIPDQSATLAAAEGSKPASA